MTTYIGKKLDFLMKLTDTNNNTLAGALNFDSSHISRIRKGQRGIPKQKSFLEPAAEFFARRIKEPFQIKGAEDMICPGHSWPRRASAQTALIAGWLAGKDPEQPFFGADAAGKDSVPEAVESRRAGEHTSYYFGNEGKRQAVDRLLDRVLDEAGIVDLKLYSDEDMSWLTEQLVIRLLKKLSSQLL